MMDEKMKKIMSDGTKIPLDVYSAFTEQETLYERGKYVVRTTQRVSTVPGYKYDYVTMIMKKGKLKAIKTVSE